MVNIIALLAFASFICLIAGLVKPTAFSRFIKGEITRKKIAIIFGIAFLFFSGLLGTITNPNFGNLPNKEKQLEKVAEQQPSAAKEKQPKQQALPEKVTEQKIETKEQPRETSAEKITATALHAAYKRNEIEADGKYGGKILEVSGNIGSIEKATIISGMAIGLNMGDTFGKVVCELKDSEKDKAVKLRKGQFVVVQGKHTRVSITDSILNSYILKNCIIKKS